MHQRDTWLNLSDADLLAQCTVDTYRASGPGGQKRNKTNSAVRLRHTPSGRMTIAEESRSQHENKARALRRLRMAIALHHRLPDPDPADLAARIAPYRTPAGRIEIALKNPAYPQLLAAVLDLVAWARGRISDAAAQIDVATSQLARIITRDGKLLDEANRIRAAHGRAPLRPQR